MRLRSIALSILLATAALATVSWPAGAEQRARARLKGPVPGGGKLMPWGRAADAAHPLRRDVSKAMLLKFSMRLLEEGSELRRAPRHIRKALAKAAGVDERKLKNPETLRRLAAKLRHQVGWNAALDEVGRRARVSRSVARDALASGTRDKFAASAEEDRRDMQRGWGWALLPHNDKAFNDSRFLASLLAESGQTGAGHYIHNDPSDALRAFELAWAKLAPQTSLHSFALTGSDANNLLYDIARTVARARASKDQKVDDAEILFFNGVYGGGRGRIAGTSFLPFAHDGPNLDDYRIESPHTYAFRPRDKKEQARLRALEKQALAQIEDKVKNGKRPVGGILIEPIVGAKGAYVYRPQFMSKLRALCDALQIPIFADEILTGGGRTGKFFAYEHYKGFEPDYVTFGKGLQVAGVAKVMRATGPKIWTRQGTTTLKIHNEPLLKAAAILRRIHEDKLVENAAKVGAYFLDQLREKQGDVAPEQQARGVGLLLYPQHSYGFFEHSPEGAMGRLMPYLSLSRADVDEMMRKPPTKSSLRKAAGQALDKAQQQLESVIAYWPKQGEFSRYESSLPWNLADGAKEVEKALGVMPSNQGSLFARAQKLAKAIAARRPKLALALAEYHLAGHFGHIEEPVGAMIQATELLQLRPSRAQKSKAQQLFVAAAKKTMAQLEAESRKAIEARDLRLALQRLAGFSAMAGENTGDYGQLDRAIRETMARQEETAGPRMKSELEALRAQAERKRVALRKQLDALKGGGTRPAQ